MEQLLNKENNINFFNQISTAGTNKNNVLFYNNGKYFSFGKDNSIDIKSSPYTSSFNIRESLKKPVDNIISNNNNSFLNKKRKLMTSEELELEQIQREREEVKKMIKKNMALYNRTKSGTTAIVSKVKETIYGLNNPNKNNFPIKNNISNMNKSGGYAMNFLREKAMNKINELNKKIEENNNKAKIMQRDIHPTIENQKEIKYEIINTNIDPQIINEKEEYNKNEIKLDEEKEEIIFENENEIKYNIKEENKVPVDITPSKENSYLSKIKELGSMSKLSLCNKIKKYTEICQQVLKEQENGEGIKAEEKKKGKGRKRRIKIKNF